MVASFDLTRYEPPLDYLLTRIDRLVRLLDGRVDPGFVRRECAELLQEVCAFCRARFNFSLLDAKVRARTAVDTQALDRALDLIEQAPRVPPSAQKDPGERLVNVRRGIAAIRENQHRWPVIETMLRLEIAFESAFLGGQVAISDDWDPTPLVDLVREKLTLIPEERRKDLWLQVIRSFAVPDHEDPDEHLVGYGLVDHGVLPEGFLDPDASDALDRLAWFNAWHRSRVIRAMLDAGQTSYPIPTVGVAKIVANQAVLEPPTPTELAIARAVGNLAGWVSMRSEPVDIEEFAALLGLKADSRLIEGEERKAFEKGPKGGWQGDSVERAALYGLASLASSVASLYENETPMGVALFQYKAGIELFAPGIAASMSRKEVHLQKELCRFLLERGIFSVGTKFGQNETDLVANVREDYIVVECKVLKDAPSTASLQKNVAQLLRYDSLNPAFRGRRAVLVLYNFTDVPILTPRELVAGRAWIVAINAKAGPPSKTGLCLQLVPDANHVLRCNQLGQATVPMRSSKKSPKRRAKKVGKTGKKRTKGKNSTS